MSKKDNLAGEISEQKALSDKWLKANFHDQWYQVFRSYLCERDPERDPNDVQPREGSVLYGPNGELIPRGQIDKTRTSIGMPDTWALTRRTVARVTAQPPHLKFRARDFDRADRVSRRLMHQWDRGGVQRQQKKHGMQAVLFGWSVRAWSWEENVYQRTKRVDPFTEDEEDMNAVHEQYRKDIAEITAADEEIQNLLAGEAPDEGWNQIFAQLLARKGRGGLLPIKYSYRGYTGPKADFLLIADCFPEPNFTSLQESNQFIVERRRKRAWLNDLGKWAQAEGQTKLVRGINKLLRDVPNGSPKSTDGRETGSMRRLMIQALDRSDTQIAEGEKKEGAEWLITERHVPGSKSKLAYTCEDIALGEIDYPYELEGKIAFTELVLIDSLLDGIGDSHARAIRGLQQLHDRQVNTRHDLVHSVLRPLVWTTNQRLFDNPDLIKRHGGMRLVKVDESNDIGIMGEQAAIAATAAGLQDESAILRQIQMATGETNMSMQANVDPQQARTATGARIMAYNQDILSRDLVDMFNQALREDEWMMYMLNRSEMAEPAEFDGAPYIREQQSGQPQPKEDWIEVTPQDFQVDGEVDVELGSTLADDDDARTQRAQTLWGIASSAPNLFNMNMARDQTLKALGEGTRLNEWAAQPQPEPPQEPRTNITVSFKAEDLPNETREKILKANNLLPAEQPPPEGAEPGMAPFGQTPDMSAPPDEGATGAYAAAKGQLPEAMG